MFSITKLQSLGNHEFDDGVEGLIPFIENASFPIVTSNLDLSKQPDLAATKLKNSTILTVNGVKIGVIGYLTPDTKIIATTENVIFLDEVESIRREAKQLKSQGVNILIAVGHSGFEMDKKIGREVEDIDIVIGGHTNTFLYNGIQPDLEVPEGLYPTEVIQKSGRKVYVVQAYAYTKYLGNLTVTFDDKGEVTNINGNPILVDSSIEQVSVKFVYVYIYNRNSCHLHYLISKSDLLLMSNYINPYLVMKLTTLSIYIYMITIKQQQSKYIYMIT